MQRTIRIKLTPDPRIIRTLEIFAKVYDYVNGVAVEKHTYNKTKLHHETYYKIREMYPEMPSALVQSARDVAAEATKRTRYRRVRPSKYSAARYNKRNYTIDLQRRRLTLSTVEGRLKYYFYLDTQSKKYADWTPKTATVSYDGHDIYFNLTLEKPNPTPLKPITILGLDRGVINTVATSNNIIYNSKHLRNVKMRYQFLRKALTSKGTHSAKRHLKRLSHREERFVRDVNHCISKEIVNSEYEAFAVEDLHIKTKRSKGKRFNTTIANWSFAQFEQFLTYKAEAIQKTVVKVNPAYTSQRCSCCGHTERSNRKRSNFKCKKCGFSLNSDLNAARNIAHLGKSLLSRVRSITQSSSVIGWQANQFIGW